MTGDPRDRTCEPRLSLPAGPAVWSSWRKARPGLVGYTEARVGRFRRAAITAHVVIGVLAAGRGRGVGSRLLGELELWAAEHGIHRLELTVMAHNQRARELYERVGYEAEGRRRECLIVDGLLVDEIHMAKLLTTGQAS